MSKFVSSLPQNLQEQPSRKSQMWLREASLNRLNFSFRSKSEMMLNETVFQNNNFDYTQLEESGLSTDEIKCLEQWKCGALSGRHCMIALLEFRKCAGVASKSCDDLFTGGCKRSPEFTMLTSTINLPEHFLCDSGFLFEQVFNLSPDVVTREAIKLLTSKAAEKTCDTLLIEQLNMAIKQVKMEQLCLAEKAGQENVGTNSPRSGEQRKHSEESFEARAFRISIFIELMRLHIKENHHSTSSPTQSPTAVTEPVGVDDADVTIAPIELNSVASPMPLPLDPDGLQQHLDVPLAALAEIASKQRPEHLEKGNNLLKPYIKQLSALKASLSTQLRELEDSRAYFALGLNKGASDGEVKKAYHARALHLHPDKPGGDTAKFQALQASYQELMSHRRSSQLHSRLDEDLKTNPQLAKEEEQATALQQAILAGLDIVKSAADTVAALAQASLRWVKAAEAVPTNFPNGVLKLHELVVHGLPMDPSQKKKKSSKSRSNQLLFLESLKPENAAQLLEQICDEMQKLSSAAMGLPSCGFRFGVATAMHSSYMKNVESAMGGGLAVMKLLASLFTAGDQLEVSQIRLTDAMNSHLHSDSRLTVQVHDLVVDMFLTALRTLSASLNRAADAAVDCAMAAAELSHSLGAVLAMAREEAVNEARRHAEQTDRERDMNPEDMDAMREKMRRDREELSKQAEREFEEERNRTQNQSSKQAEDEDNVEQLRVKIKSLQVQLRVQHVQALQTLNKDARALQRQLQLQLLQMCNNNILGEEFRTATDKLSSAPTVRESLFSLLADFMDSACTALRTDLRQQLMKSILSSTTISIFRKHFSWLTVFAVSQDAPIEVQEVVPEPEPASNINHTQPKVQKPEWTDVDGEFEEEAQTESKSSECSTEIPASTTLPSKPPQQKPAQTPQTGVRLALLPDYRSRAVWMACLLDTKAVQTLVTGELRDRLCDDIAKTCKTAVQGAEHAALIQTHITDMLQDISAGFHFCTV